MNMSAASIDMSPTLAQLLQGFADAPDTPVNGIASDSRKVDRGYLFLACAGESGHGLDYISDVSSSGAAAIAWDSGSRASCPENADVLLIPVAGLAGHIGEIANRFYDYPSKAMQVVGVTGTNGKTTVAWLIAQCLERLGETCGYVGTLGAGVGEVESGDGMTTPGTVELQGLFAEFRDIGAVSAAIEVSSHALAQRRVDGVFFDTVLFTNLSRDHLDYHGDMRTYADTKAKLFLDHNPKHQIVNIDSEFGADLAQRCGENVVTVSTDAEQLTSTNPYVIVDSIDAFGLGSKIRIRSSWGDGEIELPLLGRFNVENAAIVLAFLLQHGVSMQDACDALSLVDAPPGRLQRVAAAADLPAVYVDYAHTPAAIEVALRAVREHCQGKLWCVFGCGGERDIGKRPLMGRAAEEFADAIVITNDNPRSESPDTIVADIVAGLSSADAAMVITDRAAAIAWTVSAAAPADVILLAGKGHENYQLIGNEKRDFSDYLVAAANLEYRANEVGTGE